MGGKSSVPRVIPANFYDLEAKDVHQNVVSFKQFAGKVILVANIATKCDLTAVQITEMVQLQQKYGKQGFEVLAFPCSQFGNREHKNPSDTIQALEHFKVDGELPLVVFSTVYVNGSNTHPAFIYCKHNSTDLYGKKSLGKIGWNYGKFLLDQDGGVYKYYTAKVNPSEIEKDICDLLEGKVVGTRRDAEGVIRQSIIRPAVADCCAASPSDENKQSMEKETECVEEVAPAEDTPEPAPPVEDTPEEETPVEATPEEEKNLTEEVTPTAPEPEPEVPEVPEPVVPEVPEPVAPEVETPEPIVEKKEIPTIEMPVKESSPSTGDQPHISNTGALKEKCDSPLADTSTVEHELLKGESPLSDSGSGGMKSMEQLEDEELTKKKSVAEIVDQFNSNLTLKSNHVQDFIMAEPVPQAKSKKKASNGSVPQSPRPNASGMNSKCSGMESSMGGSKLESNADSNEGSEMEQNNDNAAPSKGPSGKSRKKRNKKRGNKANGATPVAAAQ